MKTDHRHLLVKVCGLRNECNVRAVASLQPSFMGFIFWKHSKRNAEFLNPLVVASLPSSITPVAVFVNESLDNILRITTRFGINTVQLHGDESPQFCNCLRRHGYTVIKAIGISSALDFLPLSNYSLCVDMFVFDTKSPLRGGTGVPFNRSVLLSYSLDIPYLLSGGISPDDADSILNYSFPGMVGIDINSRFESAPGIKDIRLLQSFFCRLGR